MLRRRQGWGRWPAVLASTGLLAAALVVGVAKFFFGERRADEKFFRRRGVGGSDPHLDQYRSGGQGGELGVADHLMVSRRTKSGQPRGCRGEIQKPSDRGETGKYGSAKKILRAGVVGVGRTPDLTSTNLLDRWASSVWYGGPMGAVARFPAS